MKYWAIRWDASQGRSSRKFKTFLDLDLPFEAYGFKSAIDIRLFNKVRPRDEVFCYQNDETKYVAKCRVKRKEKDAPGGRCLVLVKVCDSDLSESFGDGEAICNLSKEDAKRIEGSSAKIPS